MASVLDNTDIKSRPILKECRRFFQERNLFSKKLRIVSNRVLFSNGALFRTINDRFIVIVLMLASIWKGMNFGT